VAVLSQEVSIQLRSLLDIDQGQASLKAGLSVYAAMAAMPLPGQQWLQTMESAWAIFKQVGHSRSAEVDDTTMALCLHVVPPMLEGWSGGGGNVISGATRMLQVGRSIPQS
jgi:hypothetical protein